MGLVLGSCRRVRQPEPEFDDDDEDVLVLRRKTALIRVGGDAQRWWGVIPTNKEEWKNGKEFILKALKESPSLPPPPMSDCCEHLFPEWLRKDRDVMLAFTRRPDFVQLVHERHFYPPKNHHFKGDKEIMLAYCTWIPRSLQHCSNELRDDPDIVRAAVSHGGLEQWQYASLRLQADPDIVHQAFASAGNSLLVSHPPPPIPLFPALVELHPSFILLTISPQRMPS